MGQGHERVAAHSEVARRQHHLSQARNHVQKRATEGKGEGRGGLLPQGGPQGPLDGSRGATVARVDDGGIGAARRRAGERTKQDAIMQKEKEASDLKKKYFGADVYKRQMLQRKW